MGVFPWLLNSYNIFKRYVFIAEARWAFFELHMDCVLRTVVETGITNLTAVRKMHLIHHRDIVRGTYFCADSAESTVFIDNVAL